MNKKSEKRIYKIEKSVLDELELESEIDEIFGDLKLLLIAKNKDYGNSFHLGYEEFGLQSIYMRLKDKINRLGVIQSQEAEIKDETIENVLQDIICYSVLTLLELKNGSN